MNKLKNFVLKLNEANMKGASIKIGEAIAEIKSGYSKIEKIFNKLQYDANSPELENLDKIKSALHDLEVTFSTPGSKPIGLSPAGLRLSKLDISRLIEYLDKIATFKKFRNPNASYDDSYYIKVPYELLVKYGFSHAVFDKIESNTIDNGGGIYADETTGAITIYGGTG